MTIKQEYTVFWNLRENCCSSLQNKRTNKLICWPLRLGCLVCVWLSWSFSMHGEFIYKMYILWLCKLSPYFVCSPSGKDIKGVEWTLSLPPIVSIIEGLGKTPWWFFLGIVSYYVRSPHNIHLIITNTSVCEMYRSLLTKGIQSCGIAKNKEYSFWQPVWQHSIFWEKVPSSQFTYKQ